jgi:transposase
MIESKGCKMELLPPYSPDYNPIEYTFSVIKAELKDDYEVLGDETNEELKKKVRDAVAACISPMVAKNQFRHCRINVD